MRTVWSRPVSVGGGGGGGGNNVSGIPGNNQLSGHPSDYSIAV